jgi:hypothetical protein
VDQFASMVLSLCQSCLLAERKDKRCSGHSLEK